MTAPDLPSWGLARRVGFRFVFAYVVVSFFPYPLGAIGIPWDPVSSAWLALVPWVGAHVLHLATPVVIQVTGSGDTLFDFVKQACAAAIAVVATIAWSILARRRREHARLHGWLRVYVRYVLAGVMLGYGASKVYCLQFPFPSPERLAEPYGESSPMGLLWTFMGLSPAYQTFTGLAEVLGAALLLSRRTATLGALVVGGVMTNVVMLNFCYDVPVKLYASNLLFLAVFLLAADAQRLARVFVLNRPVAPASLGPTLERRWQEGARLGLKVALVAALVYQKGIAVADRLEAEAPPPPESLYGAYVVEEQTRAGVAVPPLLTDGERWRLLVVRKDYALTEAMDRGMQGFKVEHDEARSTLTLRAWKAKPEEAPVAVLTYTRPVPAALVLTGTWNGAPLTARLTKMDPRDTPLTRRGFHWVQEFPYAR